ncbi:MAG: energy-coupling factor ABC transporter permease [Magnetococcales bacterium]|nr:energy-coupling factor ABC transporter permease [Magnetococcales bacterium]MBF0321360.1 energy-coupling factor ABC transporter permease [Magnetococcales bacterium]
MHMSDALISAEVGVGCWLISGAAIAMVSRKLQALPSTAATPMLGVMGAFVFAAQMVNFAIPGTGSSGHLAGGVLLAVLLGSHAAFLAMAAVLVVQALFFADGGLLALGANIINMGVMPCLLVYPLVFRPLAGGARVTGWRWRLAVFCSALLALQLGALGVVVESRLSDLAELPWLAFLLAMLPIHLAIGVVEGFVSVAVLLFLYQLDPERREGAWYAPTRTTTRSRVLVAMGGVALVTGVLLPWYASSQPDGLEWSVARVIGRAEPDGSGGALHRVLSRLQKHTAPMPDYEFGRGDGQEGEAGSGLRAFRGEKSLAGLVGGALTLIVLWGVGWGLRRRSPVTPPASSP